MILLFRYALEAKPMAKPVGMASKGYQKVKGISVKCVPKEIRHLCASRFKFEFSQTQKNQRLKPSTTKSGILNSSNLGFIS